MTKADTIRLLHAERCSESEIALAVDCPVRSVRWFLANGMMWQGTMGGYFHTRRGR